MSITLTDEEYAELRAKAGRYDWIRNPPDKLPDEVCRVSHYKTIYQRTIRVCSVIQVVLGYSADRLLNGKNLDMRIDMDRRLWELDRAAQELWWTRESSAPPTVEQYDAMLEKLGFSPQTICERDENCDLSPAIYAEGRVTIGAPVYLKPL